MPWKPRVWQARFVFEWLFGSRFPPEIATDDPAVVNELSPASKVASPSPAELHGPETFLARWGRSGRLVATPALAGPLLLLSESDESDNADETDEAAEGERLLPNSRSSMSLPHSPAAATAALRFSARAGAPIAP